MGENSFSLRPNAVSESSAYMVSTPLGYFYSFLFENISKGLRILNVKFLHEDSRLTGAVQVV